MNLLIKNLNFFYTRIPIEFNKSLFCIFDKYDSNDWKNYLTSAYSGIDKEKYFIEKNDNYKLYIKIINQQNEIRERKNYQILKILKGDINYSDFKYASDFRLKPNSIILGTKNNVYMSKSCNDSISFVLVMEDKTDKI